MVNKREIIAYDTEVINLKKSFGQRCMHYLDHTYFNSMPVIVYIKKTIYKYSNVKMSVIK